MTCTALLLALAAVMGGGGDDEPKQPDFEIVLKTNAVVRGADVLLADLVDVLPAGAAAFELGQTVFAPAPVFGYARTVTRHEVLQALVLAGQPAGRFLVKGASEVLVQSVATEIPFAEITEAADAVLGAVVAASGADIETELMTRVRHVQAPPGRRSREVRPHVHGDLAISSAVVDVDIMIDDAKWKTLRLQYRLTRYAPVVKTIGAVRAGTPLGPENLVIAREKQTSAVGYYVQRLDEVAGMIARRNLQSGQPLAINDVAAPALIHRGEIVTVVLTRGRVKVTARALANHDAARGERVTLTNMSSRAQLTGIATAPGLVVVPN